MLRAFSEGQRNDIIIMENNKLLFIAKTKL